MTTCGPYICTKVLGKGGESKVFLAKHKDTHQECALKVIKVGDSPADEVTQFIKNEITALKVVEHQNIVQLLDFKEEAKFQTNENYTRKVSYIALELASKGDLINLITTYGKLPERITRFYFGQLISTLEHIHSNGYSHMDIKPDNLLFDKHWNLKLCDFGFASDVKMQSDKKGTINYAAPEIFQQDSY